MYYCYVHGDGEIGYLSFHAWLSEGHMRILEHDGYEVEITGMQEVAQ